jgi:hypothetical protein
MHDRVDADRQLTFAFVLGRRAAVVVHDRADKASGCRSRTIEAPAAQPALAGRAGLPLRCGAPARRWSQRSSAPRPLRKPRDQSAWCSLPHKTTSAVRLLAGTIEAIGKRLRAAPSAPDAHPSSCQSRTPRWSTQRLDGRRRAASRDWRRAGADLNLASCPALLLTQAFAGFTYSSSRAAVAAPVLMKRRVEPSCRRAHLQGIDC